MRKKINGFIRVSAMLLLVCMLFLYGCESAENNSAGTTTYVENTTPEETTSTAETTTEAVTTLDVPGDDAVFTMTQKVTVAKEDYLSESKYSEFLSASKKKYLTPGLMQNTVPQGLARSPSDGRIYVSSYSGKSNTPSVVLAMNEEGLLVAEYLIKNSDGSPFTGHVGGIAVTEQYMYIAVGSDGNGAYCLAEFKLSELQRYGSSEIKIENTVSVPSGTGFLSYADGILWTGNFYLKGTYDLGSIFNFPTSVDGKPYGGYAAAYRVDEKSGKLSEDAKLGYAKPYYVLAIPDKVQGFAYSGGKIALSISYGRKNDSYISIYKFLFENTGKTIKADGVEYKFATLGSANHVKTYTVMPMTEGLAVTKGGNLLVLFESAAIKYSDSRCPTDYIWETEF